MSSYDWRTMQSNEACTADLNHTLPLDKEFSNAQNTRVHTIMHSFIQEISATTSLTMRTLTINFRMTSSLDFR